MLISSETRVNGCCKAVWQKFPQARQVLSACRCRWDDADIVKDNPGVSLPGSALKVAYAQQGTGDYIGKPLRCLDELCWQEQALHLISP